MPIEKSSQWFGKVVVMTQPLNNRQYSKPSLPVDLLGAIRQFSILYVLCMQVDTPLLQQVKTLIRYSEARSAAGVCGVPHDRCHFLDMPFYETGEDQSLLRSQSLFPIAPLYRACVCSFCFHVCAPDGCNGSGRLTMCFVLQELWKRKISAIGTLSSSQTSSSNTSLIRSMQQATSVIPMARTAPASRYISLYQLRDELAQCSDTFTGSLRHSASWLDCLQSNATSRCTIPKTLQL